MKLGARIVQTCKDRDALDASTGLLLNEEDASDLEREEQAQLRKRLLELDPDVIHRQTMLLANRWNCLCRMNQNIGRRITTSLLQRQGMLLIAIRLQLEDLEAEK